VYHAVTEAFQIFGGATEEIKNAFPGNYPAMFNMAGAPFSLPEVIGLSGNSPSDNMLKEMFARLQGDIPRQVEIPPGIPPELIHKGFEDMAWKFGVMFADAKDARQDRVKRLMELLIWCPADALQRCYPFHGTQTKDRYALEQAKQDLMKLFKQRPAHGGTSKVILYRRQLGQ
jgi:hypothetical protein